MSSRSCSGRWHAGWPGLSCFWRIWNSCFHFANDHSYVTCIESIMLRSWISTPWHKLIILPQPHLTENCALKLDLYQDFSGCTSWIHYECAVALESPGWWCAQDTYKPLHKIIFCDNKDIPNLSFDRILWFAYGFLDMLSKFIYHCVHVWGVVAGYMSNLVDNSEPMNDLVKDLT